MKAIRIHEFGGVDVLRYEELPEPEPGPGEARVRLEAAGVNFIDIYHRTGQYKGALPLTLGQEGAGVVEAVGPGVTGVRPGDRVAFASVQGAYAEQALVPADRLVPVPDDVDTRDACAVMLQGLTAHYLAYSSYALRPGDTALVHAAAGGLGLLLVQIARRRGARVIGTVSTEEKARLAREAGADEVIRYTEEDFVEATRRIVGRRGVDVVYGSVGKTTFDGSLACLRPRGVLVLCGQSSGAVPPLDPQRLNAGGSLFLTRPTLAHHIATRDELLMRAGDLFRWMRRGELRVRIDRTFPLEQAGAAHQALESRATQGKLLLIP
ncbi:MAG: quinone oxidoreductase [Chloroflexota bacterium]